MFPGSLDFITKPLNRRIAKLGGELAEKEILLKEYAAHIDRQSAFVNHVMDLTQKPEHNNSLSREIHVALNEIYPDVRDSANSQQLRTNNNPKR